MRSFPAGSHAPLASGPNARSASSPCITDPPVPSSSPSSSSERKLPGIYIQNVKGEKLPSTGLTWRSESGGQMEEWAGPGPEPEPEPQSVPWQLTPRSLPEEARRYSPDPVVPSTMGLEPRLHHSRRSGLSSSQSSIFTPSPDAGISRGRPWNSSLEELQTRPGTKAGLGPKALSLRTFLVGFLALNDVPALLVRQVSLEVIRKLSSTRKGTSRASLDTRPTISTWTRTQRCHGTSPQVQHLRPSVTLGRC